MFADKDTRVGDVVTRTEAGVLKKEPVTKVKPDGTRVTRDKTGKIHTEKRPERPLA
ncbi:MAG: hypothetical protein M3N59_00215 [bacterium]|nr:hypothetical protein [bacterium]